jgi:hypothetical protein
MAKKDEVAQEEAQAEQSHTVKIKGGDVSFGGVDYIANKDGIVEVPVEAAALLVESHGFEWL